MNKLTPWFPITAKPTHIGWYEYRGYLIPGRRMRWSGRCWMFHQGSHKLYTVASDRWRGLTGPT